MFRFADVPISLSGMTRIQGKKVFLRAPTMEDWPEWAELRARSRSFLTPWEPTWPDDSLGRDHFRRRLRQQIREWRAGEAYGLFVFLNDKRRLVGGINLSNVRRGVAQAASVGYWMGQPYAGQGLMTDGAARDPALRVRRAPPAPARSRLPAAQRALQGRAVQGRLPRGGAGAAISAHQWPVGRPPAVRPAARRLRYPA